MKRQSKNTAQVKSFTPILHVLFLFHCPRRIFVKTKAHSVLNEDVTREPLDHFLFTVIIGKSLILTFANISIQNRDSSTVKSSFTVILLDVDI